MGVKPRDQEGYILIHSLTPEHSQQVGNLPILTPTRIAGPELIKSLVAWQDRLGAFYIKIVELVCSQFRFISDPVTRRFINQYLLYPFLSGAVSGTISVYKSWRVARIGHFLKRDI